MEPLRVEKPTVPDVPRDASASARWLRPELVAEVRFSAWTADGRLRHASFVALREDRAAKTVARERPAPAPSTGKPARLTIAGITISHPEREVASDPPFTKGDLARYYEAVAARILPEVVGRPLSVIRCPDRLGRGCFYQRHKAPGMPPSVREVAATDKEGEPYLAIDGLEGLIALVQFGAAELHPWGSRADRSDRPDRLVFDLDPAEDVGWPQVIEAAHELRARLEALGLQSFAKTTGGKGLHLVVPIERRQGWDAGKAFAASLARTLAADAPRRFTATLSKAARRGRIFIDYLRNERGATAVAAYSVRSRPGVPVAMPVPWAEVSQNLDPRAFTARTVPEMVEKRADPWEGMERLRQRLPKALSG
jgi:bifunctional non-homologous end joining protein LigD